MKTRLTTEQSQHLIDLGVPKERASLQVLFEEDGPFDIWNEDLLARPIFALEDFLNGEILPKEIDKEWSTFYFSISSWKDDWDVNYYSRSADCYLSAIPDKKELIDALYQLACWYYGEYLKSENEQEV